MFIYNNRKNTYINYVFFEFNYDYYFKFKIAGKLAN